ncbi:hypothetical protein AGMMS49574_25120 [Bacteroidia bacterium]|nr:hypothetical protein AGMMS49574_25120 [Bacteroidia bacterium]
MDLETINQPFKNNKNMAQSVSNDALWVKLSEIDKKLDELSIAQELSIPIHEQAEIKPDFNNVKDEIITEVKGEIQILGMSNGSHFEANRKNIQLLNDNILKILNIVSRIRKQQKETVESKIEDKGNYFNFWFFKVRKTALVITILGLPVFILTLFCMKQQNDYLRLMDEYRKQDVAIQKLDGELKALEEKSLKKQ